jgi:hypothetical protein
MQEDACLANQPDCTWDEATYTCYFKNMVHECNFYYGDDCPVTTCNKITDICPGEEWDTFCAEKSVKNKTGLPCYVFDSLSCCGEVAHCAWDDTHYACSVKEAVEPSVPTLTGKGSHDPATCVSQQGTNFYTQVEDALIDAAEDCGGPKFEYNNGVATDEQLKCLAYYVANTAQTDFVTICPCLWLWGQRISPDTANWMKINC